MKRIPRKQGHIIAAVVFTVMFIVAFFYTLMKERMEMEERYTAEVQKAYDETIRTEMAKEFFEEGFEKGRRTAEPDEELLAEKEKIEKKLVEVKKKALEEVEGYGREQMCKIAYQAGVARGETDARKSWSVEYRDEKTGVDIGKILSIGKKKVRLQLKYRNFPVGAPIEVEVDKNVELDKSAVCGLLKGLRWTGPGSYQFFEGVREEVCGSGRIERNEGVPGEEEANEEFWEPLP